ncbi:DUF563 domain-containing protein, partial [archaeon]
LPLTPAPSSKKYKLVIYQRDLSRKLLKQDNVLQMLHSRLDNSKWEVEVVMHIPDRSPCTLHPLFAQTTLLLTPHGFQSMLLLLMPPSSLLFEVFPFRYYKPAYSPFGAEMGVHHGGVMSPPTYWLYGLLMQYVTTPWCTQTKMCRVNARDQDVM